ncbi:hypothetical protein FHQ25_12380, partial [Testudinibacter sp. TR-2022]|uniref:VENN motif pre-toxin domain-containing protein n=1 Tax=Testudinibacter sp. TR-2022 TaxID=2585029 RepID=UPI001172E206
GTGGSYNRAVDTATKVITLAIANGSTAQLTATALSPLANQAIKDATTDENGKVDKTTNLILHGILGAVEAQVNGGSALGGAAAAITGEVTAELLAKTIYGKSASELDERERQNISSLSSLTGALAATITAQTDGTATDSTTTVVNAATGQAIAESAVENNYLNSAKHQEKTYLLNQLAKGELTEKGRERLDELIQEDLATNKALFDACRSAYSAECAAARKDAIAAKETYTALTYHLPKEKQQGYQEIADLLNSTTPEANIARVMYEGYVEGYKNYGFNQEESEELASYTLAGYTIAGALSGVKINPQGILNKAKSLAQYEVIVEPGTLGSNFGNVRIIKKTSAIPHPEPIAAGNGLIYQSNPKHTQGGAGNRPNAGIEPKNSFALFEKSVLVDNQRFAIDEMGNIHQFTDSNSDSGWHWAGATNDKFAPLKLQNDVKSELRKMPGQSNNKRLK